MALPSNVAFGTVIGRFMRAVADGTDPDRDPDGDPMAGLTIRFTPSSAVFRNKTAAPPVTIIADPIEATTNTEGVLVGSDNVAGIRLLATDDADLSPTDWTWQVAISGPNVREITFNLVVPSSGTVDLTTVMPVPSDPGTTLPEWLAAVETVQEVVATLPARVATAVTAANIPGQVAAAIAAQAGKVIQGVGMPNAAVTAAPGTLYVDTASTDGANIWRKATGTGNTGWIVTDGDTNWRNVLALLNPLWVLGVAGYARLKRVGTHVTFNARLAPAAALVGQPRLDAHNIWDTFPTGTAPAQPFMLIGRAIIYADGTNLTLRNNSNALEIRYGAGNWGATDLLMVTAEWEVPRGSAWPSPLFGTA